MEACYRGHLNVVKRLKESGAAWDVVDAAGHTALTWAMDGGHAEVVSYILKDGVPVRTIHPLLTCMHARCMPCVLHCTAWQVDREDGSQWTPLQRVAALRGNPKVAKALIDAGADVNKCDGNQTTVLMVSD